MIDLKTANVGDKIVFANGIIGVISVNYNNGGARFLRWDEYDDEGSKRPWSGCDSWCCVSMFPNSGRRGQVDQFSTTYHPSPRDIVEIIPTPFNWDDAVNGMAFVDHEHGMGHTNDDDDESEVFIYIGKSLNNKKAVFYSIDVGYVDVHMQILQRAPDKDIISGL